MGIQKLELLYEGKAKKVYKTNHSKQYIVTYKDDATAFNGEKKGTVLNKGVVNNQMSAILFQLLEEMGIENHFIQLLNDREMLVKSVEIIPLEVIIRNVSAGSMAKRLGLEEGIPLISSVLEFSYKNDELGDPLINDDHIEILGLATKKEVEIIKYTSLKINEILQQFFITKSLKLIDLKLEFGRYEDKVILADEISPDNCRLWDLKTNEKMDKDRFRRDLGNVEETYQEVLKRLNK
ncbi:phosphoribosylaminoimidazolesuccinocarboxamide synthase [Alkaliphilus peptidifermentans]|uniref:Phosphoribosylaminoimidazole-succinocarboxamide synthase n=1 Tax=Alkaliphilus peptidifermentans DSM 18978 TaxID=1120976 RepID=A0A1G5IB51_9FIRM|nr:phosphoribosylaminoimidazolesuccinocarboxamide synthase [Alkaliphilus peptidifermentans]SCY72538.1 phosphoribosylaminoimidazole-succinocarboxamide synthase [Alkaliphilus peptidifermentans DSM 18978]